MEIFRIKDNKIGNVNLNLLAVTRDPESNSRQCRGAVSAGAYPSEFTVGK